VTLCQRHRLIASTLAASCPEEDKAAMDTGYTYSTIGTVRNTAIDAGYSY